MKDIEKAPFMVEAIRLLSNLYRLGWDERNGGNLSFLLNEKDYEDYLDGKVLRTIPMNFSAPELIGCVFLVTGTGKYFKNVEYNPAENLGIIRVASDGSTAELLWGYSDGGKFTSELPAHLMTHVERLKLDPKQRVVLHCHPTNVMAMTMVEPLDEIEFTKTLWRANTECIVVFPEGIGLLPWQVCGTYQIGRDTADKMRDFRVVVWAIHGILGTGNTLDEAFGLVETVEKTAQVYMLTKGQSIINTISDDGLWQLAKAFGVTDKVKSGWLN